jgi:hypothetical protein
MAGFYNSRLNRSTILSHAAHALFECETASSADYSGAVPIARKIVSSCGLIAMSSRSPEGSAQEPSVVQVLELAFLRQVEERRCRSASSAAVALSGT